MNHNTEHCLIIPYLPELNQHDDKLDFNIVKNSGNRILIECINWPNAYPDNRKTTVYCAHNGTYIYLRFECEGNDLRAVVANNLGPVANDSCVEFFISPDKNSARYWNFEFNAIGRKNISSRIERNNPRRLDNDELALIDVHPSAGTTPFEEIRGVQQWYLDVRIPLCLLNIKYINQSIEMHGNFYKCGSKTSSPHYLSWAPILTEKPDFHQPAFFGKIILE